MGAYVKLDQIKAKSETTTKQKVLSIGYIMLVGIIMGVAAKLVDAPGINPIFDDIGGRLAVWVFVATLISVFSYSPKWAAVNIFAYFGSMLTVYYAYTVLFLHFSPERAMVFWGICAVGSPICGYIMWYARGNGLFSNVVAALPITLILSEGFQLRHAYLPIHTHYYLIPYLMTIYLIMSVVLLLVIPTNKIRLFPILSIALIMSFIMVYFNVLGRIFDGMNGVL
ncbi:hypothetical protein P5G61_25570 [Paenibacillus sp. F6_3S_P_1C]|uniref:Uncharacterized protein n=1 Tax=Paenibacillus vandeheii TaxID=3035917 RepID=A0ABT8JJL0_9BACL|nr:hypothetical protein [Paenibacillus vandeheii]MDN4604622.1 hypothetical protein [Paenibacillus vandeheii]